MSGEEPLHPRAGGGGGGAEDDWMRQSYKAHSNMHMRQSRAVEDLCCTHRQSQVSPDLPVPHLHPKSQFPLASLESSTRGRYEDKGLQLVPSAFTVLAG